MTETRSVIVKYLESEHSVDARDLERSTNLLADGVLDSFALMNLIAFLDERFSIEITDEELLGSFKSLSEIVDLVDAKVATGR
jgi:acyl carrier protein